jgi:hypothetical protein
MLSVSAELEADVSVIRAGGRGPDARLHTAVAHTRS